VCFHALSCGRDGTELQNPYRFEGHRLGVLAVDASRTSPIAVSSSIDGQILVWNLQSGTKARSLETEGRTYRWPT
jgi:WD40 repeat protein